MVQGTDQGILELSDTTLKGKGSLEDLLLILNVKRIRREKVLKMFGYLKGCLLQETPQHPYDL